MTSRTTTRKRPLDAASIVFVRDGSAGSTTRAIADEAGVNGVRLFRHFRTKERLLAAGIGQNFETTRLIPKYPLTSPTDDLWADSLALAQYCEIFLIENIPLVRTMIGEVHRQLYDQEKQSYRGIIRPFKEALIALLESTNSQGVRILSHPPILLADLISAMFFTATLRYAARDVISEYTREQYFEAAADLVLGSTIASSKGARV